MADIEIYVNGIATGQIQNLNAWVDVARAEIMEKYQPGEHDKTAYLLNAIHVQEGEYFSRRVHDDIDGIMVDIKEAHKGRAESAPEKSVAAELKKDLDEVANFKGSRLEQWLSDLLQAKPHPLSPLDGRRKTEFDTDRLQIGFCEVAYTTEGKKAKIKNIYSILAAEIFCRYFFEQFVTKYIDTHSNIGYTEHGGEANVGAEHQQRSNPWAYRYHHS